MPQFQKVDTKGKVVEENRTFFCSELVAKAYKVFGIYNSNKSCARMYPKHFSSRKANDLKLVNAWLGEEKIIDD